MNEENAYTITVDTLNAALAALDKAAAGTCATTGDKAAASSAASALRAQCPTCAPPQDPGPPPNE